MVSAALVLRQLARRERIAAPVALVAAHPDDETIGAGASLRLFSNLTLVHVTDGAPRALGDARAAGFTTAAAYGAARRGELAAALRIAAAGARLVCLDVPDQGASDHLGAIADRLAALFAEHGTALVITHAYEGGHPDHDAAAFAVHAAAGRGNGPAVLEMAGYHADPAGGMRVGRFLPGGATPTTVALDAGERAVKRAMLDSFGSQRATLTPFGTATEVFRPAPPYDFAQPPHAGPLHYERHDWGMTGPRWRALARQAAARA